MKLDNQKNIISSLIGGVLTSLFNCYQIDKEGIVNYLGIEISLPIILITSFITGFIIVFLSTYLYDLIRCGD